MTEQEEAVARAAFDTYHRLMGLYESAPWEDMTDDVRAMWNAIARASREAYEATPRR